MTLKITRHRGATNKMNHMVSINTAMTGNDFCKKMSDNPDNICSKCYCSRLEKIYINATKRFTHNKKILLSKNFKPPKLNIAYLRLHSFGELVNYQHFLNFIKVFSTNSSIRSSII